MFCAAIHPGPDVRNATVWEVKGNEAVRLDARQDPSPVAKIGEVLRFGAGHMEAFTLVPLAIRPGDYYPCIARPRVDLYTETPGISPEISNAHVQNSRGQLMALREQLERIFRTVHPEAANFSAYGHDIRNLLILAATETETHWKSVMQQNGAEGRSTNDYVKLLPAMKLDEYGIELPFYPWIGIVRPFQGWRAAAPTQSLGWYDNYNSVKHDRQGNFALATLQAAILSVCAVCVMNFAMFGLYADNHDIMEFFALSEGPKWSPADCYCTNPPFDKTPTNYPFG